MSSMGLILISVGIVIYGIVPLKYDLGTTHAFNVEWPAHARFHVVSQVLTNFLTAVVALSLVWIPSTEKVAFINISVILSFCVIGCFFVSAIFWGVYRGKLKEERGMAHNRNLGGNALVFGGAGALIVVGKILL